MRRWLVWVLCAFMAASGVQTSVADDKLLFEGKPLQLVRTIPIDTSGIQVFFFLDGNDPDTGQPLPPPSVPLAPITQEKQINFLSQEVIVPGDTLQNVIILDLYLRQRYFFRNDGQNRFRALTFPVLELKSPAFDNLNDPDTGEPLNGVLRITLNILHLDAAKTLVAGESGLDSRGNKHEFVFTREFFDSAFGAGVGEEVFKQDLRIRILLENRVIGLHHFVLGTRLTVLGN